MKKILIMIMGLLTVFIYADPSEAWFIQKEREITEVLNETARQLYYTQGNTNPKAPNRVVGPNERGGDCGDYSFQFILNWFNKYQHNNGMMRIVLVNQPFEIDGIYTITVVTGDLIKRLKNNQIVLFGTDRQPYILTKVGNTSETVYRMVTTQHAIVMLYYPELKWSLLVEPTLFEVSGHRGWY
jgi:hypothetical protein